MTIENRNRGPPKIEIPRFLYHGANRNEFYTLPCRALKLLIDLYSQYNGRNNGDFCMAWSIMAKRGWALRSLIRSV